MAETADRFLETARLARRFGAGLRDLTFDLGEDLADVPDRLDFLRADLGA